LGDIYLFEGDPDNAILSLNEAAKIEPRDPRIFMSLSRAYQAKGMSAEAMKAQRAAEQLRGVSPN
jgi:predicted Zn-dependent protease